MSRFFRLFALLIFVAACTGAPEEIVEKQYDNGNPMIVGFFEGKGDSREKVHEIQFYENGNKKSEGDLKKNKKQGTWKSWHESGQLWSECPFDTGLSDGRIIVYYPDGKKRYVGFFSKGIPSGKWTYWDASGNVLSEKDYGLKPE
ncbi:MAG: hypothetical protein KKA07_06895 [Bacteroidetes bacterium]|nr:hypothetical protein [Bacteroidota bacterium]MBU1718785.1 hypothetical protein [Bacteroidota bacterium]